MRRPAATCGNINFCVEFKIKFVPVDYKQP